MIAVVLVYLGLMISLLACLRLAWSFISKRTSRRGRAAYLLGVGVITAIIGLASPASDTHIGAARTMLDRAVPVYQFDEFHSTRVMAPRDQVYRAIKAVTPDEILFFRLLTWLRRLGQPRPKSVLNAPGNAPLLQVATGTSFVLLGDKPDREIALGSLVSAPPGFTLKRPAMSDDFANVRKPGFAIAAMNFVIEDAAPNVSLVTTETRVYATDPVTRRRFAAYWRVIYPGSALIRRMWLRAVKLRAEKALL